MNICPDCLHSMDGADNRLRCRKDGLKCSPALSEDCKHFEREAGADAKERDDWCRWVIGDKK